MRSRRYWAAIESTFRIFVVSKSAFLPAREIIGPDNRAADLRYDRCAPSLIAFGSRDEAAQFTRKHGGEVRPFREIAAAFAK